MRRNLKILNRNKQIFRKFHVDSVLLIKSMNSLDMSTDSTPVSMISIINLHHLHLLGATCLCLSTMRVLLLVLCCSVCLVIILFRVMLRENDKLLFEPYVVNTVRF